jgi:hypothetical protein
MPHEHHAFKPDRLYTITLPSATEQRGAWCFPLDKPDLRFSLSDAMLLCEDPNAEWPDAKASWIADLIRCHGATATHNGIFASFSHTGDDGRDHPITVVLPRILIGITEPTVPTGPL